MTAQVDPKRSAQMARIASRDTKPELLVRKALCDAGLRYRLHPRTVFGRPDVVFRNRNIALFVHGCFWHRHKGCPANRTPKSRIAFWKQKFADNVKRDRKVKRTLKQTGWRVIVVWECEIQKPEALAAVIAEIGRTPKKRSA